MRRKQFTHRAVRTFFNGDVDLGLLGEARMSTECRSLGDVEDTGN